MSRASENEDKPAADNDALPAKRAVTLPAPIIDEPPEPRRIRRPADLLRAVASFVFMLLFLGIGMVAGGTTRGAESDISKLSAEQKLPLGLILAVTSVLLAVVPIALAIDRLYRRDSRRVVDSVLAAAMAYLAAVGLNATVSSSHTPKAIRDALTLPTNAADNTAAFHIYLATVIAYLTIIGFSNRHNFQTATWIALIAYGVVTLIQGDATIISLAETVMLGRLIAFGWRWARGVINDRPTGEAVHQALSAAGLDPLSCRRVPAHEDVRRYVVATAGRGDVDALVLDRDQQAAGLVYRLYRRARLRGPAQRRNLLTLRRMLEQEALMSYAVTAADIATPQLLAVRDLGPDTGMLAYQLVPGRTLEQLEPEELTDGLLGRLWAMLADLHEHQLAHRRLSAHAFLIDDEGGAWLTDLRLGEIAAGTLSRRLDTAEMLTVTSLYFGYERSVAAAVTELGEDDVAAALPMLQPVILTRTTRTALKKSKGLLSNIQEAVQALHPSVEPEPVKLERFSPRTLFAVGGAALASYLLLASNYSWSSLTAVNWWWTGAAAMASVATYFAAAMALDGFVPEKLRWRRTVLSQVAASFVTLVAPAAVGGVAVNTRYLQRTGLPTRAAVTAVGAQQIMGLVQHLLLILIFGVIAGSSGDNSGGGSHASSATLISIILALALLVLLIATIPQLRRFAVNRLRPLVAGVLPRLMDVAQNPIKLATGLGGTVMLSLLYSFTLWASIQAAATDDRAAKINFAVVAFVFLTAQAAGSIVPTPGGVGGVEGALIGALTTFGHLDTVLATTAVLLFRLMTFWLPVLPGWFAYNYMTRHGEL
ncbi:flippase-like domain-containing protein [Catenulispora sp. NF23]|uniref:Flippase-like domain-containing protein n=1 Tax=Catenulispora pinistramenti TaxID=2705254 RepID=A0ABS5KI36_9ACTN|nr:lysylphosphatidylglycerol synthase domain-containing protein [Catenulispora pinistramenti]MBS2531853.1 flippase-like domain-containing protein [Catenulispora pinistramenti]MBS2546039.1 flippase-like domain-containing protein [Catenulispora pinistramenti]